MELGQLTKIRGCILQKQLHNLFIVHDVGGWQARELYLLLEEGLTDLPKFEIDKVLIIGSIHFQDLP